MSLFSRLFGTPPPPPNSVLIPEDLVPRLIAGGDGLPVAVERIIRGHYDLIDNPPPMPENGIPFWLQRETSNSEIEDELRQKVNQRNAEEQQK